MKVFWFEVFGFLKFLELGDWARGPVSVKNVGFRSATTVGQSRSAQVRHPLPGSSNMFALFSSSSYHKFVIFLFPKSFWLELRWCLKAMDRRGPPKLWTFPCLKFWRWSKRRTEKAFSDGVLPTVPIHVACAPFRGRLAMRLTCRVRVVLLALDACTELVSTAEVVWG